MKRIEMNVDKCDICPYLIPNEDGWVCSKKNRILTDEQISSLPLWCPLPDVEEKTDYCDCISRIGVTGDLGDKWFCKSCGKEVLKIWNK